MIKLSKKWSIALKAVIYIAKKNSLVNITEVSESEKFSLSMLRRIVPELEKSGIIETIRWRNGWIKLWKKIHQISVFDILDSIWEELWITDCTKWLECENSSNCSTENLLWNLQKWFNTLLHIYTLDKIIK
jgi:Rrf2 family iron-responsive transcriptional regulator